MRFEILHRSPGRLRLRAEVRNMRMEQADILEAWIAALPGVERATVRERTNGVTVLYHGNETALRSALAGFSFAGAERSMVPLPHSSRAMNREYKEKLVFLVIRHYAKRLLLPAPVCHVISIFTSAPRIIRAAKTLLRGELTVDVLDGVAIGVSLLTGDHGTAGSVGFLLKLGETLDEWTHKKYVPKGFFTPPFETCASLYTRLSALYSEVRVDAVRAERIFCCKK